MKFYCGIDLSARDCHVCVIDEQLQVMVQQKLRNDLTRISQLLQPYQANLKIVVESTFNWYWLIDGLQAEGFEVILAHTLGLYLITGAKVKTDRRDAYALAKLLLVGAVPTAYIYPVETRPVRDLLRRRLFCVVITEQREARCFMASPLGCLVQFTHLRNSVWDRWPFHQAGLRPRGALARITKAACGEVGCSA